MRGSTPIKLLVLALLGAAAPAWARLSPAAEESMRAGVLSLYSLDYEDSRAAFRRIIESEPENPFGYLFESGGIWWQSSQEYGLFKGTPTLQGQFEADVETALRKAETLMKAADREARADGHFVAGMALGTRGQWALMRGHYLKACFDGRKAVKHLEKCLKTDPEYFDAYLGLGVYDYQAARLPAVLKLSAMLCGAHGNEKRGLERMFQAMEKGRYGSRQAAQFLATLYIADKHDYARALAVVRRLRVEFPESPYFMFLEAALDYRLGDWDGSLRLGRDIFIRHKQDFNRLGRKLLTLACGISGEKCLDREDAQRAHSWFSHAIDAEDARPDSEKVPTAAEALSAKTDSEAWLSLNHLFRGYASDVLAKREEALKDYRWVLEQPDFADLHSRARECTAAPCGAKPLLAYLRALSRSEPWPPAAKTEDGPGAGDTGAAAARAPKK